MKPHEFDSISFLAGAVIAAIGLLFLIPREPDVILDVVVDFGAWFWPVVFVAVGIAVLAPLATRARSRTEEKDDL